MNERSGTLRMWKACLCTLLVIVAFGPVAAFGQDAKAEDKETSAFNIWEAQTLTGDWGGVRTDLADAGITFSPLLVTVHEFNFMGGTETHNAESQAGKMFWNLELDFGKMGLLDGATFFIRGVQTWGDGIQRDVGSVVPPYWSAGSSGCTEFALDKFWYRQRLFDDRLEFRIGKIINIVDLFDKTEYADTYTSKFSNRAFGNNLTMPTVKGMGIFARVWPVDWMYAQGFVVDPDTIDTHNRHGTGGFDTVFDGTMRFSSFWEVGFLPHLVWDGMLQGHYRFGVWYDARDKLVYQDNLSGLRADRRESGDIGFYLNFDQMVWKENDEAKDKQGLGIFARYGHAHEEVNRAEHFWSMGASYLGLVPSRDADVLAFGVAQTIVGDEFKEHVSKDAGRETIYELYYKIKVTPWCEITPDLQWISNPGALDNARDALCGGVRVSIAF